MVGLLSNIVNFVNTCYLKLVLNVKVLIVLSCKHLKKKESTEFGPVRYKNIRQSNSKLAANDLVLASRL